MTTKQGAGMASSATTVSPSLVTTETGELHRAIDWRGAFWVAAGVPPLVLFSIGGIAGTTGKLAFLVWIISMIMGFLQSFTYAEIAGMFGNKSGGASVYGATAWLRYSQIHRAAVGVVQLVCLVAGAVARLRHCGGLHPQCAVPDSGSRFQAVLDWVTANAASLAADSPRVAEWLAANAGKTAQDAITALLTRTASPR